jgi:hypothetical protein
MTDALGSYPRWRLDHDTEEICPAPAKAPTRSWGLHSNSGAVKGAFVVYVG